jgi:phospholipase/lecithinase/hemolysin
MINNNNNNGRTRAQGGRIPFAGQVQNYQTAVQTMVNILGDQDTASDRLSKCIFSVGMGSNDYLNNYFMPAFYSTGSRYTPQQFADTLIADYRRYLQVLYNYGARKVVLIGVGQVGCSPNELARYSPDGTTCVERIDGAIRIFNGRLVDLVDEFNALPGAHFTYVNAYNIFNDIQANAAANGFTVTNAGCCGVGRNNGQVTCLPYQPPCANRDQHIFWDAFHPSEAANIIVGRRSYRAQSRNDVYPMDISTLASISV